MTFGQGLGAVFSLINALLAGCYIADLATRKTSRRMRQDALRAWEEAARLRTETAAMLGISLEAEPTEGGIKLNQGSISLKPKLWSVPMPKRYKS